MFILSFLAVISSFCFQCLSVSVISAFSSPSAACVFHPLFHHLFSPLSSIHPCFEASFSFLSHIFSESLIWILYSLSGSFYISVSSWSLEFSCAGVKESGFIASSVNKCNSNASHFSVTVSEWIEASRSWFLQGVSKESVLGNMHLLLQQSFRWGRFSGLRIHSDSLYKTSHHKSNCLVGHMSRVDLERKVFAD